jgi:chitin disaccharide deacetylase
VLSVTLQRQLIVNADDFGLSAGVNRGIIEAHEHGIVTSASLMVRWPAAAEAADYSQAHPNLSLGLHVDLGEWIYRNETWVPLYQVVSPEDAEAVALEVSCQLATFRRLVGRDPTHLDSHQRVHSREPVRSILVETARELRVPLRHFTPGMHHCGDFYGQTAYGDPLPGALTVEALTTTLAALPPGITELGCHPAVEEDFEAMYRSERALEVRVLCDPRVRAAIAGMGIVLRSFDDTRRDGQLLTLLDESHD